MPHLVPQHRRPIKHRGSTAVAAVCLGALATAMAPGSLERPATAPASPSARAARTVSLNDTGRMHLTSKHGFTLNEQGAATGTVTGPIFVHLKIVSTKRVIAEVNIYPHGSSISGYATASYRKGGAFGNFTGSMAIRSGSGSYARSQGSVLSFSGTIQRSNDAVTVHVSGSVTD